VAGRLNNLGEMYRALGRYADAEGYLRRALAITEVKRSQDHPDVALTLGNLASVPSQKFLVMSIEA